MSRFIPITTATRTQRVRTVKKAREQFARGALEKLLEAQKSGNPPRDCMAWFRLCFDGREPNPRLPNDDAAMSILMELADKLEEPVKPPTIVPPPDKEG